MVFTVNVTPNRADALSHLGIAREVATLFNVPLKTPAATLAETDVEASTKIAIRIDDPERCWRYAARVIEGVTVKASPAWMQERLKAAGMRGMRVPVQGMTQQRRAPKGFREPPKGRG